MVISLPALRMPHMNEVDVAAIDRVGDLIHRVADDSIAILYPGGLQRRNQNIGYFLAHK
jgi:hypothetical protein